jgi:hypothetical protein
MTGTTRIPALAAALFLCACGKGEEKTAEDTPAARTAPAPTPAPASASGGGKVAPRPLAPAPPPKLLDQPVERRLYSDRIEASSFLWTDWNKFQENYHPNYILDGDPATAWVEGADSSGKGEWVRIHFSPVEGATRIRLRVQNGYHKSKVLHGKNARLKTVEVVALPGQATRSTELKDSMEWQEITLEQPAGKLEAIELRVAGVYEGSKYTDLCVSDLEIYVTGLTAENPAFEKSKLDQLLAWKQNRLAAAKILGGAGARSLPVLPGYRVVSGEKTPPDFKDDGKPHPELRSSLTLAGSHGAPAEPTARATAALAGNFKDWVRLQVVARHPLELPDVDGLRPANDVEMAYGGPEKVFVLPASQHGVLLQSGKLSTFDTRGKNPIDTPTCRKGTSEFMRPPRAPGDGPALRELLHVRCVTEETREGEATYMAWQVLEFDADGNLVLIAGPVSSVTWLEWKKNEQGNPVVASGGRLRYPGQPIETLTDARVVATP